MVVICRAPRRLKVAERVGDARCVGPPQAGDEVTSVLELVAASTRSSQMSSIGHVSPPAGGLVSVRK